MKILIKIFLTISLVSLFLLSAVSLSSQSKGGHFHKGTCLHDSERNEIFKKINQNKNQLGLSSGDQTKSSVVGDLLFPMVLTENISGYNVAHAISGYVDHQDGSGTRDYNCLDHTYDGHLGTDIFPFPFGWEMYKNNTIQAVSCAAGTVMGKDDGQPDTNCEPNGTWNGVYIMHDDGSIMLYGHLKLGSLTTKAIGERVEKGEYLGVVASSGYSTGIHLHIEYYDADQNLQDPYEGACNSLNNTSLWQEQKDYKVPTINAVLTHDQVPINDCGPENEVSAINNRFFPGDFIYISSYYTNVETGDAGLINLYRPNGTRHSSYNAISDESYGWFYSWNRITLTEADPAGTWTVIASFKNTDIEHTFQFNTNTTSTDNATRSEAMLYPNPTNGSIIRLSSELYDGKDYQIIDNSGSVISDGKVKNSSVPVYDLSGGLYYLQITSKKQQSLLYKFIKI